MDKSAAGVTAGDQLRGILKARTQQYGGFAFDAETTARLCLMVFGIKTSIPDLAKTLLCMKLGRLAHGEISRDSLLDLAGYACILADIMRPKEST